MTLFFPDVSSYTPNVNPALYPIILARATLSASVADSAYNTFKARAAASGTVFVAYHWLNHGNLPAQARWAFQHVGGEVPLMIDAEDEAGNTGYAGPLTIADILGFAAEYRRLGGIVSLVYLPFWYWSGPMGAPHQLDQLASAGLGLVSSNYPTNGYTENGPGWAAYYQGAPAPVQWQYTDTPIDMNAYKGTVAEYSRLVGVPQVAPESVKVQTMFLAKGNDPSDQTVYLCTDDWKSHPIASSQDLANIVALFDTGAIVLNEGNNVGLATDWEPYGTHPKLIRTGWYPGAFGPVPPAAAIATAATGTDTQISAAVAAVMNDPAWLAKLAAALRTAPAAPAAPAAPPASAAPPAPRTAAESSPATSGPDSAAAHTE
jgi:hypothetical protein